ncbi:ATP/GTP-binding protein [uncultured Demequina sp.]|uniref:GTP-binding protein n=1 Tax=uncultured Demequina sp. TaxID=693499 RepID=UPI0025FC7117|nr:ATP/GTP-binding protein [uncultured Demequina sp.]
MTPVMKIVVAGPFGSGKTTFVRSACPDAIGSERAVSDETARLKEQTTVAMDHGTARIEVSGTQRIVTLFGTPGQERFSFMWPLLARGMAGYVLLVDVSRLQSQAQAKGIARRFQAIAPGLPLVLAANRWDPTVLTAGQLSDFVGVPPECVMACDPRVPDQARAVLSRVAERSLALSVSPHEVMS